MSTPTNQQAGKEKKPPQKQGQTTAGNKSAAKSTSAAAKPAQITPRPAQNAAKTPQAAAKTTSPATPKATTASAPKAGTQSAPKAATPPAPKPRDPSVVQRDVRREERRLEIQARQQERRQELRQAKRQKLLIRYDLIIAPILLIVLVSLFLVLHLPIEAIVSGIVVLFGGFTVLAYAAVGMPTRSASLARPKTPTLPQAGVVESTIDEEMPAPATQTDEETEDKPAQ